MAIYRAYVLVKIKNRLTQKRILIGSNENLVNQKAKKLTGYIQHHTTKMAADVIMI